MLRKRHAVVSSLAAHTAGSGGFIYLANNTERRTRIGMIGYGWAGERHAVAVSHLADRAELVAVAETRPDALREAERRWNVPRVFDEYSGLLALDDLDGVIVSLPHSLHAQIRRVSGATRGA